MVFIGLIALLLVKFLAYSAWCWFALRLFGGELLRPTPRRAMTLAAGRVLLGFVLGWPLLMAVTLIAPEQSRVGVSVPIALAASVMLRLFLWSLIGAAVSRPGWRVWPLVLGARWQESLWRAGGLLLSFLTDVGSIVGAGVFGLIPC